MFSHMCYKNTLSCEKKKIRPLTRKGLFIGEYLTHEILNCDVIKNASQHTKHDEVYLLNTSKYIRRKLGVYIQDTPTRK